ncbi:hypothetical protein [Cecembia calidifontis]|jgi:hypothetical protein|uniref:Uncharacterized protein n=1 Tax=Cecembia calidifontis TaxID=1187080 RepID=A0A4Q7PDF3_9BACT|nr:hypothetical protein [Cecembia calidifontis]RZS98433.1 hypothetical protein BC751_4088 [Cecembia calidifontis]
MKFSTLFLYGQKNEGFNSWLGKDTVKVNGEVKSSKYSLFGAAHHFKFEDDEGVSHECKLNFGINFTGVVMDVYLDKQPVIVSPVTSSWVNLFFFRSHNRGDLVLYESF